ncbi:MAG: LysR substrate-binding domain-containing protein [Hyphomicrobiaceae bacterium]
MRNLPTLNGLRAFEAAARRQSFTAAGDELVVSPAAISRLVKLLEERLDVPLFHRTANRLQLTAAGRSYRDGLTPLFDQIERLTAQVTAMNQPAVLTVGVGPTFAVRWLIPRLSQFQAIAPDTELRFATGGAAGPFRSDWTCGIALSNGAPPGLQCDHLLSADLLPVCSPASARDITNVRDLVPQNLLRVAHATDDWPRWFAAVGAVGIEAKGPVFEFYGQAIQAAADGVGIAMGIRPYVDDDLAAGRLVSPFQQTVSKEEGWHLVYRPDLRDDPVFGPFRDWIIAAAHTSSSNTVDVNR